MGPSLVLLHTPSSAYLLRCGCVVCTWGVCVGVGGVWDVWVGGWCGAGVSYGFVECICLRCGDVGCLWVPLLPIFFPSVCLISCLAASASVSCLFLFSPPPPSFFFLSSIFFTPTFSLFLLHFNSPLSLFVLPPSLPPSAPPSDPPPPPVVRPSVFPSHPPSLPPSLALSPSVSVRHCLSPSGGRGICLYSHRPLPPIDAVATRV